jgi:hypothetical protein
MKQPQKLININKLTRIIFSGLIIAFIILFSARIFLNDYLAEIKKIVKYEGNLLEHDAYNILQRFFNEPIEVEFKKMKYRKKMIFLDDTTYGEYEYNLVIKDITRKILVNWEMDKNGLPSITIIKESGNKNILYQR